MKRVLSAISFSGATLLAGCNGNHTQTGLHDKPAPELTPFTVKIVGFNDFHGNLASSGNHGHIAVADEQSTPGGADYLAGHIAKLKAQNPLNVVVGAGDLIGASPMISALFNDEPTIETLNRAGLEFSSVGNDEFGKGSAELLRLQKGRRRVLNGAQDPSSCKGKAVGTSVPFKGAKFNYLSANVVVVATGKTLLPAYATKILNGVKLAFIGITLKGTSAMVAPTGVAGLQFNDEVAAVNSLIPKLHA